MATTDDASVSFDEAETRRDEMHATIDAWLADLVDAVETAQASEQFQRWLDVQSAFHDYSYRNTLLIERQCPGATKVAGYRTWQVEFDRHVQGGEQAIWIWAPIITERCPRCENSESYHEQSDCEYNATPPAEWDRGPVALKPVPVFIISQTEGEPLPELETVATGDTDGLVDRLLDLVVALNMRSPREPFDGPRTLSEGEKQVASLR